MSELTNQDLKNKFESLKKNWSVRTKRLNKCEWKSTKETLQSNICKM